MKYLEADDSAYYLSFCVNCFYRYVSAVDKALKNFEYTSEWADLISALGKLNKVFLFLISI